MLKRVIQGQTGRSRKTVIVAKGNAEQPLHIIGCETITLRDLFVDNWQMPGDVVKGKPYAIQFSACKDIIVEQPIIIGAADDSTKDAWRESVCNGIRIDADCVDIRILEPDISRVHFGMDVRGSGITEGGRLEFISADHVLNRSDNFTLQEVELLNSLFVLPYSMVHRDYVQLIKLAMKAGDYEFIENVLIQACVMKTDTGSHKWAEDPDQPVTLTDGYGKDVRILENQISTEKDIAILMNPCQGLTIRRNIITSSKKPTISCEDRKKTGCAPSDIDIGENHYQTPMGLKPKKQTFAELSESLRGTNKDTTSEDDYIRAGNTILISPAMVAAVAKVESGGDGYNADGSLKLLLERHWSYKLANRAGWLHVIQSAAGLDNCNPKAGGYLGGIREYGRVASIADADCDDAINIALGAVSMGEFQIMGFNHKMIGYDSPLEMFESFSRSSDAQIDAFIKFILVNGLAVHLREAEELIAQGKSPLKPLDEFAKGYNGKSHKNYHLKIAAAYQIEKAHRSTEAIEVEPAVKGRTMQGSILSTVGNTLAGGAGVKAIIDQINSSVEATKATIETTKKTTEAIAGQVNELQQQVNDQISSPNYLLWIIIAGLVLSQTGILRIIWVRLNERWTGKNT